MAIEIEQTTAALFTFCVFYMSATSDWVIEGLTWVDISYEIYETSLRRVSLISYEMTTSASFRLLYDPLKWDFIAS